MADETRSALTPEEWAKVDEGHLQDLPCGGRYRTYVEAGDLYSVDGAFDMSERDRHALAALALHGQPFGFTWEDVSVLRDVESVYSGADPDLRKACGNLAARIAALLPPRGGA